MDKKSLLYRLGETKLKWPKDLRKFIYYNTDYQTTKICKTHYVNTLEMWHDKLLMRSFAYNVPNIKKPYKRPYKMEIQEVCRRLEGEKEVLLCQVELISMGGRKVCYTHDGKWITKKGKSNYYPWYEGNKKSWWFYGYEMFSVKEWIQRLNIPYCGYDNANYTYKLPFFEYVELYKKYPKIELLAKAGWGHLIRGARYLNLNGRSFEQIFKIPKYWRWCMYKLSTSDILKIRKYKIKTYDELQLIKIMQNYTYIKKYYTLIKPDWLVKNMSDLYLYNDYLRFVEKLGMPLQDKKVLYPDNISQQHDSLAEKIEIVKSKLLNDGISKNAKRLEKYQYKNDCYIIMPAKNYDDLARESAELNHCVRTYAEKVANGETGIMLLRMTNQIDKPFVTVELKDKKIIQARASHNNTPPKDASEFIKRWERKFRLSGW